MIKSVEDVFRPAFEEIARRSQEVRNPRHPTFFEPTGTGCGLPFVLPDQRFVLLTLGTAVLPPLTLDATRPAMRVYGTFATHEDATDHAEVVRGVDPDCSLLVAPTHEWVLFPQTEPARDDPAETKRRRELRLQEHRVRQAEQGAAFEREVRERVERPPPSAADPEPDEGLAEAEAVVYPSLRRMRGGAEVRGHAAVALCVIPDEVRGECMVKVLGCFESVSETQEWVQNVATRHVTEDDVLVARTCEWVYPNGTSQGSVHYRAPELQHIMDAADRNTHEVRKYKDWKSESNRKAPEVA